MADVEAALKDAMAIDGALAAALVDSGSGMTLGSRSDMLGIDLELAGAAATDVVRANRAALERLGLHGEALEDTLITLTHQYDLIRPLTCPGGGGLFLHLILDRHRANLAMARHQARLIEETLLL